MGAYGAKFYFAYVIEAAEVLNHSAVDLWRDPERSELMALALSYKYGKQQGEFDRELNPSYQQQVKASAERIKQVRGW